METGCSKGKINYNTYTLYKLRQDIKKVYYDMSELKKLALKQLDLYGKNASFKRG